MRRAVRILWIAPALAATAILADFTIKHAATVLSLRQSDLIDPPVDDPLVAPISAVPAIFILLSLLLFWRGRDGLAAVFGVAGLAVAALFWLSQAAAALG